MNLRFEVIVEYAKYSGEGSHFASALLIFGMKIPRKPIARLIYRNLFIPHFSNAFASAKQGIYEVTYLLFTVVKQSRQLRSA